MDGHYLTIWLLGYLIEFFLVSVQPSIFGTLTFLLRFIFNLSIEERLHFGGGNIYGAGIYPM